MWWCWVSESNVELRKINHTSAICLTRILAAAYRQEMRSFLPQCREDRATIITYSFNDDTVLLCNQFTPIDMRKISPFRAVEKWLLDYEPAVGVLDYTRHNGARVVLRKRRQKCGIKKTSPFLPTVFFDAIFNAFHHKAVEHLLPYPTRYEPHNWYCINPHTITKVEVKFPGQAILFAPVTAGNPIHRPHKKNQTNVPNIWRDCVEEIIREAPPKLPAKPCRV